MADEKSPGRACCREKEGLLFEFLFDGCDSLRKRRMAVFQNHENAAGREVRKVSFGQLLKAGDQRLAVAFLYGLTVSAVLGKAAVCAHQHAGHGLNKAKANAHQNVGKAVVYGFEAEGLMNFGGAHAQPRNHVAWNGPSDMCF